MKASTSIPAVRFIVWRAAVMVLLSIGTMRAQIRIGSFSGPVTSDELTSFRDYVTTLTPAPDNIGNNWAQGHAGEQVEAMGLVYEVGHDSGTLDQMIRFCDAVLSERNDLASAPVGQHVMWRVSSRAIAWSADGPYAAMLDVTTRPSASENSFGSSTLRAPRFVVSSHDLRASSTHRAIAFTPSPCLSTWRAISESVRNAVVKTNRTLPC